MRDADGKAGAEFVGGIITDVMNALEATGVRADVFDIIDLESTEEIRRRPAVKDLVLCRACNFFKKSAGNAGGSGGSGWGEEGSGGMGEGGGV